MLFLPFSKRLWRWHDADQKWSCFDFIQPPINCWHAHCLHGTLAAQGIYLELNIWIKWFLIKKLWDENFKAANIAFAYFMSWPLILCSFFFFQVTLMWILWIGFRFTNFGLVGWHRSDFFIEQVLQNCYFDFKIMTEIDVLENFRTNANIICQLNLKENI